jgi:hypothetical protein
MCTGERMLRRCSVTEVLIASIFRADLYTERTNATDIFRAMAGVQEYDFSKKGFPVPLIPPISPTYRHYGPLCVHL